MSKTTLLHLLASAATTACLLLLSSGTVVVNGHGYLKTPRSRNLLAFEETIWWPQTEADPLPESCPHCLNRGGTLARCGMIDGNESYNYDKPQNALGGRMPWVTQATYTQGSQIVIDVSLTAVHMGHFVFSACPLSTQDDEVPSQECFDEYKLTFVQDLVYGATPDSNYPERAYVSPMGVPTIEGYVLPDTTSSTAIMNLSYKMQLPPNFVGQHVLLQWYYLTANSCYHDGYLEYDWPEGWAKPASARCDSVSLDGNGIPEQFWNCAEITILPTGGEDGMTNDDSSNVDAATPTTPIVEVPAPTTTTDNDAPVLSPIVVEETSTLEVEDTTPVSVPSQQQEEEGTESNNYPPTNGGVGSHGKTIVGYYASWQWYDRSNKASPEAMDFTKLQRVNFAFFQTDTSGNIWGTDSWADPIVLFGPYNWNPTEGSPKYCSWDGPTTKNCNNHDYEKGLIHLAHAAGAEVYPSLGGWTLSDAFPAMASDATARATFAQNCVNLIVEYGFDGIDIDWEYPGYVDHSGTPQDTDNFRLLLDDVRAKLDELGSETGRFYGLTAALPCGPLNIANMDIAHVAKTLSQLNLMTYDYHGAWSETTGTNAPLYDQGWGEEDFDVHNCVKNWIEGGASRDKINIGLPFYGRSFATATGLDQPHTGADQTHWSIDDGTPQYFNIVPQLSSMTSVWDEKTFTQYAYFADGGLVSFDNENAICAKVQYVQEHELAGFIIWELSGDVMEDLSTPLLDITNAKLNNPDLSCGEAGIRPDDASLPQTPASSPNDASSESLFDDQPSTSTEEASDEDSDQTVSSTEPVTSVEASSSSDPSLSAVGKPSNILICDNSEENTFNIADSKSLEISFWYEFHCDSNVPESNCMKEVKNAMVTSLADKLNCASSSRLLQESNDDSLTTSMQFVKALDSAPNKDASQNAPCSVVIDPLDVPTNCYSMIGSLTTLFDKDTPDIILNTVRDELLFTIRIDMSLGIYESDKIKKVVYGDLIEHKINSSFMTSEVQSEEGKGKTTIIIAILFSVFAIALLGVLLFVFRKGKKTHNAEVHSIDGSNNTTWRMALDDTGKSWKEKLYTYKTDSSADNNRSSALVLYESKRNKLPDHYDAGEDFRNDDGSVSRIEMINEQQPKKAGLFTSFMHSKTALTTSEEEKQVDNANREYNEEKQHDAVGEQNVNSMTISAMKAELESHNIATDKILEKRDLIDTLLKVRSDRKIDSSSSMAES